jgi:hypothetical protein
MQQAPFPTIPARLVTDRPRAGLTPSPLSPPLPSRAKQNSFLHFEILIRHLAPRPPLLLVPSLHHRQATASSGYATTEAAVHHKPRPKRADAVRLYGCLSDGRPPPTASDPAVATTRSAPTSQCCTTSKPAPSAMSPVCRRWCPSACTHHRGGASAVCRFLPESLKPDH